MKQDPRSERQRSTLLVVEDDAAMRELLQDTLSDEGYRVEIAAGGRAGIDRVQRGDIDLVITDVRMPDLDGLDMLREIRSAAAESGTAGLPPHVIVITAFGSIDTAIKAVKLGAHDYITKPFRMEALIVAVEKALEERGLRREVARLRKEVERPYRFDNIIGRSSAMQEIFDLIRRLSGSAANVLITGESGTGKELVARAVHYHSPRAKRPFVAINCAAIPDTLLESELFGYKRGAFTDARTDRQGLFVEAEGGTLFLDEIGDLSPALQAKLLRVLAEREIRPLGAQRPERVDVRVLAATHRDLEQRMREGTFREDLFYRLNVIQIHLPPLRERPEDILPLAEHFFRRAAERGQKAVHGLTQAATKVILQHGWPGNVRELENVMERAVALCSGPQVLPEDLPVSVRERRGADLIGSALARNLTLAELEREYIARVLQAEGGNKTRAAQRLGLDRKTLYRKLDEQEGGAAAETPPRETREIKERAERVPERALERPERQSERPERQIDRLPEGRVPELPPEFARSRRERPDITAPIPRPPQRPRSGSARDVPSDSAQRSGAPFLDRRSPTLPPVDDGPAGYEARAAALSDLDPQSGMPRLRTTQPVPAIPAPPRDLPELDSDEIYPLPDEDGDGER